MEGACILLLAQEDEAKVERSNPLKWIKVQSLLEASNRSYELLLAVEAHSNVVPHF